MIPPDYSSDYDPDADFDRWYTALTARLIAPQLGAADRVLELGSATGALTQRLAGQQRRIICVERAPAYIARGARTGPAGRPALRKHDRGLCSSGPVRPYSGDQRPARISGRAALLCRIRAMLAPEGRLHVTLPNPESLHRLSALAPG